MNKLMENKKVIFGALVALVLAYYLYDQKRKSNIKARAEKMASTPAEGSTKLETEIKTPTLATPPIKG